MNIGIITFHSNSNFGALLQAYALQQTVISMGYNVQLIDFRPHIPQKKINVSLLSTVKKIILLPLFKAIYFLRRIKIYKFISDYFILSKYQYKNLNDFKKYPPLYDAYICGSDQIWNVDITKHLYAPYFLGFTKNNNSLKIAYAPSFGKSEITDSEALKIRELLSNFDFLSSREKSGVAIIKALTNLNAEEVLDPVFLLKKEVWDNFSVINKNISDSYILLYTMEIDNTILDFLKRAKDALKIKVLHISWGIKKNRSVDITKSVIDPKEFIFYLKNASLICTNSFHGTAFSLIFNKPFFVVASENERANRISNLLTNMKLSDHIVKDINTFDALLKDKFTYDTNMANSKLNDMVDNSLRFLKTSLSITNK